jgi:CheY-like chemotaxis protein
LECAKAIEVNLFARSTLEATRSIRALPDWQRRPILALTANAFDDDRHSCAEAGMDDFIAKPI